VRRLGVIAALVCVALVVVGCGTEVPDVKGMTVDQASAAITAAGFKAGAITYDEKAQGAPGAVIAQVPAAGSRANKGMLVALTLAGTAPVVVPNFVGLTKSEAAQAMGAAGLILGTLTSSYSATAAVDTVVLQEPAAGTSVAKGSAVALRVSAGKEPVAVPTVKGKKEADAKRILGKAGFRVKVRTKHSNTMKGVVIAQDPYGAKRRTGTVVWITVSSGPDLVKVPKVIGMYPDDAAKVLRAAGLRVKEVSIHGPIDSDAGNADIGQVYRQTPKAGSYVPKGTVISIRSWWEAG
jgi:eukaryotic-like serine/threonine-protein kinase